MQCIPRSHLLTFASMLSRTQENYVNLTLMAYKNMETLEPAYEDKSMNEARLSFALAVTCLVYELCRHHVGCGTARLAEPDLV